MIKNVTERDNLRDRGQDSSGWVEWQEAGCCECNNELSVCVKCG